MPYEIMTSDQVAERLGGHAMKGLLTRTGATITLALPFEPAEVAS